MKRLMGYTTPMAIKLYLMSFVVPLIASLLAYLSGSGVVQALGFAAALLMWWPLTRDLVPVAFSVLILGRWPIRQP